MSSELSDFLEIKNIFCYIYQSESSWVYGYTPEGDTISIFLDNVFKKADFINFYYEKWICISYDNKCITEMKHDLAIHSDISISHWFQSRRINISEEYPMYISNVLSSQGFYKNVSDIIGYHSLDKFIPNFASINMDIVALNNTLSGLKIENKIVQIGVTIYKKGKRSNFIYTLINDSVEEIVAKRYLENHTENCYIECFHSELDLIDSLWKLLFENQINIVVGHNIYWHLRYIKERISLQEEESLSKRVFSSWKVHIMRTYPLGKIDLSHPQIGGMIFRDTMNMTKNKFKLANYKFYTCLDNFNIVHSKSMEIEDILRITKTLNLDGLDKLVNADIEDCNNEITLYLKLLPSKVDESLY